MFACIVSMQAIAEVVEKTDGRFAGTIELGYSDNPMIESLSLTFEWWGLFDQPVEYYKLRWELRDYISLEGGRILRRRDLSDYPDLLARYDDLRPASLELKLNIGFLGDSRKIRDFYYCRGLVTSDPTTPCVDSATKTIKDTPHLMIAKSGTWGDNITPTSPENNWLGFFDELFYSGRFTDINNTNITNKTIINNLKVINKLVVKHLSVEELQLPESEIRSIIKELERRKENKNKPASEKENKDNSEDSDDFWGGGSNEQEDKNDKPEGNDDFWGGSSSNQKKNKTPDQGFWGDAEPYKIACNESYYTTWDNSQKKCVELTLDKEESASFGIEYAAGGAGVHIFDFPQRPAKGQQLNLSWDMFDVKDRAVVIFIDGQKENTAFDSGMISGTGRRTMPPFQGDSVRVIMTGSEDGTKWNFTLRD